MNTVPLRRARRLAAFPLRLPASLRHRLRREARRRDVSVNKLIAHTLDRAVP